MTSRKYALGATLAVLLSAFFVYPAGAQPPQSQRQLDLAAIRADRKAIVGDSMKLTNDEAKAFWPLYDQYEGAMDKLDERQDHEIRDFARNYDKLTNDQAQQKLDEVMSITEARLQVQKEYIPKFRSVLSEIKVTRFFQIDHKLRAFMQCAIAQAIPLAKEPSTVAPY